MLDRPSALLDPLNLQENLGIWCIDKDGYNWCMDKMQAINNVWAVLSQRGEQADISLKAFETRFLQAIDLRQIVLFFDLPSSNIPCAIACWAFLCDEDEKTYQASDAKFPESWQTGRNIWLVDVLETEESGPDAWYLEQLRHTVFSDVPRLSMKPHLSRLNIDLSTSEISEAAGPEFVPLENLGDYAIEADQLHPFRDPDIDMTALEAAENQFIDELKLPENSKALLLGCESFRLALRLVSQHGANVVVCDEEAAIVHRVSELAVRFWIQEPAFAVRHVNYGNLQLDDNYFDCVISLGVISRSDYGKTLLAECERCLGKKGVMVLLEQQDHQHLPNMHTEADKDAFDPVDKMHWRTSLNKGNLVGETRKVKDQDILSTFLPFYHHRPDSAQESEVFYFHGQKTQISDLTIATPLRKRRKTTLLTLSGGIDSTYLLWSMLRETDDDIVVLHINNHNNEQRSDIETICARKVIDYLTTQYRPVKYIETSLNHKSLHWYGYDMVVIGFEVGLTAASHLLASNQAVDRWSVASCTEEESGWSNRWGHVENAVTAACFPHKSPKFFEYAPPISKADEMRAVPEELLDLTWYCRAPKYTRQGIRTCGGCVTCRVVKKLANETPDINERQPTPNPYQ